MSLNPQKGVSSEAPGKPCSVVSCAVRPGDELLIVAEVAQRSS